MNFFCLQILMQLKLNLYCAHVDNRNYTEPMFLLKKFSGKFPDYVFIFLERSTI